MDLALADQKEIQTIPKKLFLYVYLILPILLLVVLADMFYFDSWLRPYMGIEAILLPLFIFIFNLPHIIASLLSFFDGEYVTYYKRHLFFYLPTLLIATALLLFVNYELGIAFFLISDVWHGIKQKTGIALLLGARPGWLHHLWTFLPFFTTAVVYIYFIIPSVFPEVLEPLISPVILAGIVALFLVMILKMWQSVPEVRLYIFLVSLLFFVSYFFVLSGYIFLGILAFRFVHDVSAFAFYINHDHNRNKDGQKNVVYRLLSKVPLPTLILTPVLAFLFAYITRTATNGVAIGYTIVILVCMCHYYLESVMWKRGSLHRQQIKVS